MAEHDNRHRSLPVPGLSADAAASTVRSTLDRHDELSVHAVGPGRFTVSRTRRPRWATIACASTFWLGGLGLLFLLVKTTEAGQIQVHDGPRGCIVTLPPMLGGAVADELTSALRAPLVREVTDSADSGAGDAEPTRTTGADHLDDRTVARTDLRPDPAGAGPGTPPLAVLRCDQGEITVAPGTSTVIGRDPSASGGAAAAVVPGDSSSVSKSHLLVEFDGVTLSVEDLGSTNGTRLLTSAGEERLEPGRRGVLADGDQVILGALALAIDIRAWADDHGE